MHTNHHRYKPALQSLSTKGFPLNCGPTWSTQQIEADILHWTHKLANYIDSKTTLRSETQTKVHNGSSKIIKYKTIKDILMTVLKFPPVAYIPNKSCQYHVILDLYLRLRVNGMYLSSVNYAKIKNIHSSQWANYDQHLNALLRSLQITMIQNPSLYLQSQTLPTVFGTWWFHIYMCEISDMYSLSVIVELYLQARNNSFYQRNYIWGGANHPLLLRRIRDCTEHHI